MAPDLGDRRPVVVIFTKGLGIGGAEKLISEGARFWDRSAFDYRVAYALPWKHQLVTEIEDLGVPVRCVGSRQGVTPMILPRLRRLLAEWDADIVHAHLPVAGILARLANPVPVVYTEHNLAWSYRPLTRAANRLTYGRNAAVTAVSRAVADTIAGYPGPPAAVIPNGVAITLDPEARSRGRAELGLSEDKALVVHVGNIRPGKGHEVLVETAAVLRDRGVEVSIVSIGVEKNSGDLLRLRAQVSDAGLDDKVHFLGRRADALTFIAAADVYMNPAEIEGLPVTILEAMALGRPVIATAVGGIPTVVRDGVTGLLVDPGRPDRLADAVTRLLKDPTEAQRLAQAGSRLVAAEYGLESMVRAFEGIYRKVLW
jgi:glycosyltransferase involved in cell wall biosynthesis